MERQAAAKAQNTPARSSQLQTQSGRLPARSSSPANPLLELQRAIGNQAVQRLIDSPYIQAKLQVSTPGDPFEQEADRVADTVMRMTEPQVTAKESSQVQAKRLAPSITRLVQRQAEVEDEKRSEVATITAGTERVHSAVREDDEKIAAKLDDNPERVDESAEKRVQRKTSNDFPARGPQRKEEEEEKERAGAQAAPIVHRQPAEDEEEEIQRKELSGEPSRPRISRYFGRGGDVIYRLCTNCEDEKVGRAIMVHRHPSRETVTDDPEGHVQSDRAASSLDANINALRGGGSALPETTRAFFEPRFGVDFSKVRVHTDSRAAQTAASINASAFTVGQNIAFGRGKYAPHSQPGRQLLAHELTHVVQQTGAQSRPSDAAGGSQPNVVARAPGGPAPSGPKIREPVELKGKGTFSPPKDLEDEIKGRLGSPVSVAVKFGDLAVGELPVIWNGVWFDSGPPPPDHEGHPLPINHEGFPSGPSARPVLGVNIDRSIVSGFFGWRTTKALARNPSKFFQSHPLHELFGWTGLETVPPDAAQMESRLSGGKLFFNVNNIVFGIDAFDGTGKLELRDEKLKVDLGVDIPVKGLSDARVPLERDNINRLFAGKSFSFSRKIGASSITGKITASFGNGLLDVRGTVNYASKNPKISGSLTIIVTDFERAKETVRDHLGTVNAKIQPAEPGEHLAITGWGQLDFALSEWLTGNAEVILHPEGYVTARGEIVPTKIIPLGPKKTVEKELIPKKQAEMALVFVPVWGHVSADASVGPLMANASFGKATLHDLRVAGLVSNHPDIVNSFELSGIISAPATAGLSLEARGGIHVKLLHAVDISNAGVEAFAKLKLNMLAEAGVQVGRRAGAGGEPEYYIEGNVEAAAELVLDLIINFWGSVLVWKGHINAVERTFKLGNAGVKLHFLAALGKRGVSELEIDFSGVSFDPDKYLAAVVRSETVEERGYTGVTEVPGEKTTGEEQPQAPLPPEVTPPEEQGRDIARVLRKEFTMMGEPHLLILRLTRPPVLEMSSDPPAKPLTKRIAAARVVIKKADPSPESSAQLAELDKIDAVGKQVQEAAAKAAVAPADTEVHAPGFAEAATLMHDYGDRFLETDLAAGMPKPPGPTPTPADPPKGAAARLALAKATFKDRHWVRKELEELCKIGKTAATDQINAWREAKKLFALETSATDPLKAYNFDETRAGERPLKDTESNRAKYGFRNPEDDSPQRRVILTKGIRPGSPPASDPASRYDSMRGGTRAQPPSRFVDFERRLARLGHGPVGASEFWNEGKPKPGHQQSFEENRKWNLNTDNYWGPEHKEESEASGSKAPRYLVPMAAIGSHDDWL